MGGPLRTAAAVAALLFLGGCLPAVSGFSGLGGDAPAPAAEPGDNRVHIDCTTCGDVVVVVAGGDVAQAVSADAAATAEGEATAAAAGSGAPDAPAGAEPGSGLRTPVPLPGPDGGGPAMAPPSDPLAAAIRNAEGLRLDPYRGPVTGAPHIGYGHLIDPAMAEALLAHDVPEARDTARRVLGPDAWDALDGVRRDVLAEMAYAHGERLSGYEVMLDAVRAGDWDRASAEILDSVWARIQAPARAARLADAMARGVWTVL